MALPTGKIPLALLEDLLRFRGRADPAVRVGPAVGEDAAVVDLGESSLVLSMDPVTFAEDELGWYAVHVNANDVATMGAAPRWFQSTLLLPEGAEGSLAIEIARQIHEACEELEIALVGGHTEVTAAVTRPVVVGAMQGLVPSAGLVESAATTGDLVVMTKSAGVEGTALLARDKADVLRDLVDANTLARAAQFLRDPGISVVSEALLAAYGGATALHDATEGGVAMGLLELSLACGHRLEVDPSAIPVAEETRRLCEALELNPLGLIGSGALLVILPAAACDDLLAAYESTGMSAQVIGRVGSPGSGVESIGEGTYPLEPSPTDEMTKVR